METYDIVMIIVLAGAMIFGAVKGFAWQLASIASILVSYTVAFRFREPFSQSIHADPPWNQFLAMLILYIGTSLLIWVAFRMISGTIDRLKLREFDRQVGALFGLAKGSLYCILITLFAVTLAGEQIREKIVLSKSGNYIASVLDRSESVIPPEIHQVVQPYLERFDQKFRAPQDTGGSLQTPRTGNGSGSPEATNWGLGFQSNQSGSPPSGSPNGIPQQWIAPQQARQPSANSFQR